jgi:hypothetical protein
LALASSHGVRKGNGPASPARLEPSDKSRHPKGKSSLGNMEV